MRPLYLAAILVYLSALMVVGAWFARRVRTGADFMVAGRRLGLPVLVGTLLATWIGTGSIMGNAGLGWRAGLSALWSPLGGVIGIAVVYFVAGRARRLGGFTVPDILEARYNAAARVLATMVTVVAYTVITSYQFRAGGRVLHLVTGMDVETGIVVTAAFVIAYTALAGMLSVAYTDFVNGVVLTVGFLVALPLAVASAGGLSGLAERLDPGYFAPFHGEVRGVNVWNLLLPGLLLLLGESNMYGRFFSARDAGVARRAVVWWVVGTMLLETVIVLLGVTGRALYPNLPDLYPSVSNASEVVIPHMVLAAHPALGVLLLAALAAVIVSTADSFLLTPASNLVHDVWRRFVRPQTSERAAVWLLRGVVGALGVWAWLQVQFFPDVLQAALYAYTMYGAGVTPAVLGAFFWKRATPWGGAASVGTGMVVTLLWEWVVQPALSAAGSPWAAVDPVIPAAVSSVVVLVVVSLLGSPPAPEKWAPFFRGAEEARPV
jgi:SSS family solute:Na+ symporter